jgi:type IV pilus assembly protein PilQ
MKAVWTILAAAALSPAAAADAAPSVPAAAPVTSAEGTVRGAVTAISVVPTDGQAAVVVTLDRPVDVQDFTLASPNRIVLDFRGAALASPVRAYDQVARGGIVNVRAAQFKAGTVRVVVELDARREYEIQRSGNEVRLVLSGARGAFAPWTVGVHGTTAPQLAVVQPPARPAAGKTAAPSAQPAGPSLDDAMPMTAAWTTSVAAPANTAGTKTAVHEAPSRDALQEPLVRDVASRTTAKPAAKADAKPAARTATRSPEPAYAPETARELLREPAAEPVPVRPAARPPAARVAARRTQPRVTVTYQDADIRDVIAAFASFSGRTIVVGREVTGNVTAEVKDQPWDVALRALLGAQGLAATEDRDGIIIVDSYKNMSSNQSAEPLVTQTVDVNYAKAASLAPILQGLLSRDCAPRTAAGMGAAASEGNAGCIIRGTVAVDSSTNKLLITDAPSRLPEILARIRELDIRTPQVAIKAKIVFVDRTGLQDIGVTYDLGQGSKAFYNQVVQRVDPSTRSPVLDPSGRVVGMDGGTPFQEPFRVAIGGNAMAAISNANNLLKPGALNLLYSATLGQFQLTSFLNALQQTSLADIQSEPSIVTLNNRTAEIFVGQQVPIRVIDASAGASAAGQAPRATVRLQEAGIRLSVTPQVTNNRRILLALRAENSQPRVGPSDVGFYFEQQRADNQVLVADGETAVIGGLTITSNTRVKSGIPFLVDLPLIGRLFGQVTTQEQKRDLLILVTPQILDEGETAPAPTPRR